MAYVGMPSGNANQYLQADKLAQNQPADMYDPNQFIDPQELAQKAFSQQQGYLSQQFNQQNPRMALPQNVGAQLGSGIAQFANGMKSAMNGLSGDQQAAQQTQQDPSIQVHQEIIKRRSAILQDQLATDGIQDMPKATAQAAASVAADPAYQTPAAQAIATNYQLQAQKLGYTASGDAQKQAALAQKSASTLETQERTVDLKDKIQSQRDSQQFVPVKWTKDPSTGLMYPQQTGPMIPRYINDSLTEDPDLENKKAMAVQAAGGAQAGAQVIPYAQFNQNKASQDENARQLALARIAATEKEHEAAMQDVNQTLAQSNGEKLFHGDMLLSDLSGNNTAQVALRQASMAAADAIAKANNASWSPTDMANRKAAERSWMAGPMQQQYLRAATAPRHLSDLEDIAQGLQSGTFKPGNAVYQTAARNLGLPGGANIPAFDLAKQVFALELSSALNARGGSDEDRKAITGSIQAADSPQVLTKTLATEEKLWADKFDDLKANYETNVSGKRFVGDLVNPTVQNDATTMYSKFYPIKVGAGDGEKSYFDKLPDTAMVKTPAGRVMKAGDLRALQKASNGLGS